MGIKDQALKEYLEDTSRYADLMNGAGKINNQAQTQAHYLERERDMVMLPTWCYIWGRNGG